MYFVFVFLPQNDDMRPNWPTLYDTHPTYAQHQATQVVPPSCEVTYRPWKLVQCILLGHHPIYRNHSKPQYYSLVDLFSDQPNRELGVFSNHGQS